ncbi:TerC family protein [Austwickia chelonae]|uniref:TerC family protein n=1 Tax=Austwickia chelonae TaxID=100225 RepID=UPI000E23E882|nr:TerC family protein [Austwickia chelonae]
MTVSSSAWIASIALIVALLAYDFFFHVRKAHTPTLREAATWSALYVGIAVLFGLGLFVLGGPQMGTEYFAGYITEKALSVDNLFVFLIIMSSFRVPSADQQKVLLFGIVIALIARTAFIFVGAAMIDRFAWVFYLFGVILLATSGHMLVGHDENDADNMIIRIAKKFIHTTDHYDGDRLFTTVDGKRVMTPMLLVMVAIGGTDIMFALDSIPAIFGLTQSSFIVFTATAFSLMGLRQLYFLLDGLLDRLIYLSWGLATILGFIGVKLILHALHENNVPIINDGNPVKVVEISVEFSLAVIIGVLALTVIASLLSPRGKAVTTINNIRRHVDQYLDLDFESDQAVREKNYERLMQEEAALQELPVKYRRLIREEPQLLARLAEAHETHDRYLQPQPAEVENRQPPPGKA